MARLSRLLVDSGMWLQWDPHIAAVRELRRMPPPRGLAHLELIEVMFAAFPPPLAQRKFTLLRATREDARAGEFCICVTDGTAEAARGAKVPPAGGSGGSIAARGVVCAKVHGSCGALLRRQLSRGREGSTLTLVVRANLCSGALLPLLLRPPLAPAVSQWARGLRLAANALTRHNSQQLLAGLPTDADALAARARARSSHPGDAVIDAVEARTGALPPRFDDRAPAAGLVSAPTRSAPSAPHTRSIGAAGEPPSRSPPEPPLSGEPRQRSMSVGSRYLEPDARDTRSRRHTFEVILESL